MLQLQKKSEKNYSFWLAGSHYLIGSSPHCEIFVDSGAPVSGEFLTENGKTWIQPHAENEIVLNGNAVHEKSLLTAGDELVISGNDFLLVVPHDEFSDGLIEQLQVKPFSLIPLTGSDEAIVDVNDRLIIGSASECGIVISLAGIEEQHLEISAMGGVLNLRVLHPGRKVMLNEVEVDHATLEDGDILAIQGLEYSVRRNLPDDENEKTTLRPALDEYVLNTANTSNVQNTNNRKAIESIRNEWTDEKIKDSIVRDGRKIDESQNLNRRALMALLSGFVIIAGIYYYVQFVQ